MNLNTEPTLRVPLKEIAGAITLSPGTTKAGKPRKPRRIKHRGASDDIVKILAAEPAGRWMHVHEIWRLVRKTRVGMSQSSVGGCLSVLKAQNRVDHNKADHTYRLPAAAVKARAKLAALPGDPGPVNDVAKIVDAALKQVEDAANALKALGLSLVDRAARIDAVKKQLADV